MPSWVPATDIGASIAHKRIRAIAIETIDISATYLYEKYYRRKTASRKSNVERLY
jgi:hypothetical protein